MLPTKFENGKRFVKYKGTWIEHYQDDWRPHYEKCKDLKEWLHYLKHRHDNDPIGKEESRRELIIS